MATEAVVNAPTEQRHPGTRDLDDLSTLELLTMLNTEDAKVAGAVEAVLPALAGLVDAAAAAIRSGRCVHYFGAGTSGRLAVLDAAELLPTFNAPPGMFNAHHAGGLDALFRAAEDAEDQVDGGALDAAAVRAGDIAVGITASGRTPYVAGALAAARSVGATTALLTANPDAELAALADVLLAADTGPEVLTGSTRMKAGTAQKLVLNAFSTAVMVRLGRTWSNLMVDLVATNAKLRGRVVRILQEASGVDEALAREALDEADGELKVALLRLLTGATIAECRSELSLAGGVVATALGAVQRR